MEEFFYLFGKLIVQNFASENWPCVKATDKISKTLKEVLLISFCEY